MISAFGLAAYLLKFFLGIWFEYIVVHAQRALKLRADFEPQLNETV